ncbi:uncharacterized protein C8Q71DRAFT_729190 [Rhodofomes roseus]|uniref:Uncharacterized protein n=1 Tax=Rhodofomes roseus TaxID=34475 RepID=A0A4Y9YZF9_9APHY|nr:uncharacterized protein C8Q71DRAFT_729190 [Rhodofomes roseus]KAH9843600.1 hypothetical protein C8Q71DRAFT_729190 [Rhodofomes roseus]TFY67058.1 hypothetical protein EVJ58_g1853 [Rhodofomes roseus]
MRRRTLYFIIGGVVVGALVTSLVILPAVLPGALGGLGFTAAGVQAGSAAAAIHSGIGAVAAGSTFALAQAVGAGAAIPFVWTMGAAIVGAVLGGGLGKLAARLEPILAPHVANVMRGARTVASRAVRNVGRLASWVRSRL